MFRKWHLSTGIFFLVLFLLSGLYMKFNFPAAYADNDLIRMMYRANHIYLLMAALINLLFGHLTFVQSDSRARLIQTVASVLLIIAPFLLLLAFLYEPQRAAFNRYFTFFGILCLLSAVLLYIGVNWYEKKQSN
jgi:hypothetical protein